MRFYTLQIFEYWFPIMCISFHFIKIKASTVGLEWLAKYLATTNRRNCCNKASKTKQTNKKKTNHSLCVESKQHLLWIYLVKNCLVTRVLKEPVVKSIRWNTNNLFVLFSRPDSVSLVCNFQTFTWQEYQTEIFMVVEMI